MNATPPGWPRLSPSLYYNDAPRAIDWLCQYLGFTCRLRVEGEGGRIEHSELTYGGAVIMVSQSGLKEKLPLMPKGLSPLDAHGNTQGLMLYVDDLDAHYARAAAAPGITIVDERKLHDYGPDYWADRSYGVLDLEGHCWWISERVRSSSNQ